MNNYTKNKSQFSEDNNHNDELVKTYYQMNKKILEVIQIFYDLFVSIDKGNPSIEMINLINFTNFNDNLKNFESNNYRIDEIENFLLSQYVIKDYSINISKTLMIEKTFCKYYNPKDYNIISEFIILKDGRIAIGIRSFIEIYNSNTFDLEILVNTGKCAAHLAQLSNGLLISADKGLKIWKIKHNYLELLGNYFQRKTFTQFFELTRNRILMCPYYGTFEIFNLNYPYKFKQYSTSNKESLIESIVQPKGFGFVVLGTRINIDFFDLDKRKIIYSFNNVACFSRLGMKEIPGNKLIICSSRQDYMPYNILNGVVIVNYITFQIETIFNNFDPITKEFCIHKYDLIELEDGTMVMFGSEEGCFQINLNTYSIIPFRFQREYMYNIIKFKQRKLICQTSETKMTILSY